MLKKSLLDSVFVQGIIKTMMKKIILFSCIFLLASVAAFSVTVNVIIYNGTYADPAGVSGTQACLNAANANNLVPGVTFTHAVNSTINSATLAGYDVLVMPGGGTGYNYTHDDPNINGTDIYNFVNGGKGYYGTCAGAYAGSHNVDGYYAGWDVAPNINCKAVSFTGYLPVTMTSTGTNITDYASTETFRHYNGPAMYERSEGTSLVIGKYLDNSTAYNGYIAFVADFCGAGRTILTGPHPELDPAHEKLLARSIAWCAKAINGGGADAVTNDTPFAVSSLVASKGIGSGNINLVWNEPVNPENDAVKYCIYRSTNPCTNEYQLVSSSNSGLGLYGYTDSGLTAGVTYYYIVKTSDTVQESGAIEFNNTTSDYISVPNSPSLSLANAITIEAWIYPKGWGGGNFGNIVSKNGVTDYTFYIRGGGYGDIALVSQSNVYDSNDGVISLNQWHHVAMTFSLASSTGAFYVNGVKCGGFAKASAITTSSTPLYIGNRSDLTRGFDGIIDEVRIYCRVLTPTEITNNYSGNITTSSIVSWWKLNNSMTDTMKTNHGTVKSGGFWTTGRKGNTASSLPSTDTIPPAAISNLTAIASGTNKGEVRLEWTAPGNDGVTGMLNGSYKIKYSTVAIISSANFENPPARYAVTTVNISTNTTPLTYQTTTFNGMLTGTTYYFAIKVTDGANWSVWNSSADYSGVNTMSWCYLAVSASTPPSTGETALPVEISVSSPSIVYFEGFDFMLNMEISTGNVSEARIYYRKKGESVYNEKLFDTGQVSGVKSTGTVEIPGSVMSSPGVEYYAKATLDGYGSVVWKSSDSPHSVTVSRQYMSKITSGTVIVPGYSSGGELSVEIPFSALNNNIDLAIEQVNSTDAPSLSDETAIDIKRNGIYPISVFEFGPDGTVFNVPVSITLIYPGSYVNLLGINEDTLKIYKYKGGKWKYLGGTVDKDKKTVTAKTLSFSTYGIFASKMVSLTDVESKMFLTPGMPVTFGDSLKVAIMDNKGRIIKDFPESILSDIVWDGRDENGKMVESGIYIYKSKNTVGKIKYGVIVVAK